MNLRPPVLTLSICGTETPGMSEQTVRGVFGSSGDIQLGSAEQRCNPWDGVGNRGHGATQIHRGETHGGSLVTPAPHYAGRSAVHILGNKSGSLQATLSVRQSDTPQIFQV